MIILIENKMNLITLIDQIICSNISIWSMFMIFKQFKNLMFTHPQCQINMIKLI